MAASIMLFLSDLSTKSMDKSPTLSNIMQPSLRTLKSLAAAGSSQSRKYKLLPLEVWMPAFVKYEIAAVIEKGQ